MGITPTGIVVNWKAWSWCIVAAITCLGSEKTFSKINEFLRSQILRHINAQSFWVFVWYFVSIFAQKSMNLGALSPYFCKGLFILSHTSIAVRHSHKACIMVSSSKLQMGHITWLETFLLARFTLVGRMSWQVFHSNCFVGPEILSFHKPLQNFYFSLVFEDSSCTLLDPFISKAYSDLTDKRPFLAESSR